jgi:hypothetical protein
VGSRVLGRDGFHAQTLTVDGKFARCEPKRLRYRLLHTAGRLAFHARAAVLRLPAAWPWADQVAATFARPHPAAPNDDE